jgi:hypothetical protein
METRDKLFILILVIFGVCIAITAYFLNEAIKMNTSEERRTKISNLTTTLIALVVVGFVNFVIVHIKYPRIQG